MVSCGPNTQSWNMTHMFSFVDYNSDKKFPMCVSSGSIYDYLHKNQNFSKFRTIVKRASMINQLNNSQANFTVLIPSDEALAHIPNEYFEFMDDGLARDILNCSLINNRINKELITSSPVAYYYTKNPAMRMFITNIGGRTNVNNCAKIVKYDIICNNGIIHIVDGLIAPNDDHFMN